MAIKAMTAEEIELIQLKKYFQNVITKQDYNYDEYVRNTEQWKQLTGEEFDYHILLDKSKQDVLHDDEILQNIEEIESILAEEDTQRTFDQIVNRAQNQLTVTEDGGQEVEDEQAHDLLYSLMMISQEESLAKYADNKDFAHKSRKDKKDELLSDIDVTFNLRVAAAVAASAQSPELSAEENAKEGQRAVEKYMSGRKVVVKKDHIINAVSSAILHIKDKIAKFKTSGLIKSAAKVMKRVKNFKNWFSAKKLGQLKDGLVQEMKANPAQWATNAAVTVGSFAATFASAPVALGAVATYAVYTFFSTPLWALNRKRNQEQAKDHDKSWKGWKGIIKAWKVIHADPVQKRDFNRRWAIATGVGVASAGIIGGLAPSVIGATSASTNALSFARAGTSLARVLGANANAACAYVDARKRYNKTKSEEDKAHMDAMKTGLKTTAILTAALEAMSLFGVISKANAESPAAVDSISDHAANQTSVDNVEDNSAFLLSSRQENVADVAMTSVDTSTPDVTFPESYDESMHITEEQWNILNNQKVTPLYVSNAEETYANAVNTLHAHPDLVNPDGSAMTPEQLWWKESRIVETLAKARPDGHGGLIARFWDPDGREVFTNGDHNFFYDKAMTQPVDASVECLPRCNGDERTVRAFQQLYKMVNCGEDIQNVDVDRVKQFFDETTASGQYRGEGWNIGQTLNYSDRDGCDDVHWILGKSPKAPENIIGTPAAPEPEPVIPEPAPEPTPAPAPAPVEPAPAPVEPTPEPTPTPVEPTPEVRGPAGSTNEDVVIKVNEAKVTTEGGTGNHYYGARTAGGRVTTNNGGCGSLVQGKLNDGR